MEPQQTIACENMVSDSFDSGFPSGVIPSRLALPFFPPPALCWWEWDSQHPTQSTFKLVHSGHIKLQIIPIQTFSLISLELNKFHIVNNIIATVEKLSTYLLTLKLHRPSCNLLSIWHFMHLVMELMSCDKWISIQQVNLFSCKCFISVRGWVILFWATDPFFSQRLLD